MNSIFIAYKLETNEITQKQDIKFGIITNNPEKFFNYWKDNQDYIITEEKVVE